MGPHSNAVDLSGDLPDPWDTSTGDTLPGDRSTDSDELISRLAGDDVERLMGGGKPLPQRVVSSPVQELASQLDNFFTELRQKQTETMAALARQEEHQQQQGGLIIDEAERRALVGDLQIDEAGSEIQHFDDHESAAAMSAEMSAAHRLFIDPDPAPAWYARPLDWCGGAIESLSPALRVLISLTAICTFLAACAALVYVLILRQQG